MSSKKIISLFFVLTLLYAARAESRIYIQIDQVSEKRFPVAIPNMVSAEGRGSRKWDHGITDIIKKDLELTGLFEIIPESQYPTNDEALSSNPATIQFPPWTLIGAQALVTGTYSGSRVELHLYDPFLGQHLIGRNYTTNEKDMAVVAHNFADEIVKELTGEPGVFSTQITYVQVGRKNKEIGVMDMDGGRAHTITRDKTFNLSPAWSPDGNQIAFTSYTKDGVPEIYTVSSDGGSSKRVTSNGTINISPTWSPGGALTIASAMEGDTEIYTIGRSGNIAKKLTHSYGIDVNPSWSPDGSSFVFSSERAGKLHLFRSDASGGNVQRLTFVGTQNDNPVWSPKGDKIAFQSLSGGWDIFVMNTDGSTIQRLTSTGNNESPSWAPNGRFITFSSGGKVSIMREDGSNVTAIGPGGSLQPSWGPWVK